MEIGLVVEFNVFPSKRKKEKEKCVYMNVHYYITKPQLFKIKIVKLDNSN
jgi:hypothetical protein